MGTGYQDPGCLFANGTMARNWLATEQAQSYNVETALSDCKKVLN